MGFITELRALGNCFVRAVSPCRQGKILQVFSSLGAEDITTETQKLQSASANLVHDTSEHVSISVSGSQTVNHMKTIFQESARREIVLSHCFQAAELSVQSFHNIRIEQIGLGKKTKAQFQQTTKDLLAVQKELLNLDRVACQAQAERAQVRRKLNASITKFDHEKTTLKNDGDDCRKELAQTRISLQTFITKAESSTITMQERLQSVDAEKAQVRQQLENSRMELQKNEEKHLGTMLRLDETIKNLRVSLKDAEARLDSSSRLFDEAATDLRKKLGAESTEKEKAVVKLKVCENDLQLTRKQLESSTKLAQSSRTEAQNKVAELEKEMVQAGAEINCLRRNLVGEKAALVSVTQNLKECQAKLELGSEQPQKAELAVNTTLRSPPVQGRNQLATSNQVGMDVNDKAAVGEQSCHAEQSLNLKIVDIRKENQDCSNVQKASPKLKKRQPNKSIQKANRPKRSRVKTTRAAVQRPSLFQEEAKSILRGRVAGEVSPRDEEIDDDWVVKDMLG